MAQGNIITQLYALLGFKTDTKGLEKFSLMVVSATATLMALANKAMQVATELDNFNKRINFSTQALQQWQTVAQQSNVQAESITSAFESIVKARGDLLTGSGNVKAWAILGIDPSQDPNIVFNQLLQKLGEIDDVAIRTKRLSDLGLDPQLVNLVGKSINDIIGINKNLIIINEKEKKGLLSLKTEWTNFKLIINGLSQNFVAFFFPLKILLNFFTRMISMITDVLDKFGSLEITLKIVGVAFTVLGLSILPISANLWLIIGAVVIVFSLFEDLYTFLKGGDSVIGRFLNSLLPEEWVEGVRKGINGLISLFKTLGQWINKAVLTPIQWAIKGLSYMAKSVKLITSGINTLFGDKEHKEKAKKDFLDQTMDTINTGFIKPYINPTQITNNPNITNTFNIDGAKDPKAVANEVASMQEQINTNSLLMESGY